MIKIMAVCGMGLGSSLMTKIVLEKVLQKNGIDKKDFVIDTCDVGSAKQSNIDIYITTKEFAKILEGLNTPIAVIKNTFNEQEIEATFIPIFKELLNTK